MLQNVCSVITEATRVDLTQSKGIQTGPEWLWTPQLIMLPASLEVLSGHFYPEWTQSHFCGVRWAKNNVLLAPCTNTELAQSNSWLSQKEQGWRGSTDHCASDPGTEEESRVCSSEVQQGFSSCLCCSNLSMPAQPQSPPSLTFTTRPEFLCLLFGD